MGRKKGKQSGNFATKLQKSEYQNQITSHAHQHNYYSQKRYEKITAQKRQEEATYANYFSNKLCSMSNGSRPRVNINVNQLRGLLRERILEDRHRDARTRRTMMTASLNLVRVQEEQMVKLESQIVEIGWMMEYDYRAVLAGVQLETILFRPSLELLAIKSLASVMKDYVDACGVEYMHDRIGTLPRSSITLLSIHCRDINDDIAYILGRHCQVQDLVLHACSNIDQEEDEIELENKVMHGIECDWNTRTLSTAGLLSLVNNISSSINQENEDEDILESWENLSLDETDEDALTSLHHTTIDSRGCDLQRLELRNFHPQKKFLHEFGYFLSKCPNLTHLSLSSSLDSTTGPQILFYHYKEMQFGTKTMLDILPNLQVLDLQSCQWLTVDILKTFLFHIKNPSGRNRECKSYIPTLDVVCVGSCNKYVSEKCTALNEFTSGKPLICINPPL